MKTSADILVIDDEPVIVEAVERVCASEGFTVDPADSAAAALELLDRREYRLVICDIMMPGVDGFKFLDEAARRGLKTPVVMITGYATAEHSELSSARGAVQFLAKPFTTDELLDAIRDALKIQRR